ncbi:tetratricopeptide repeat protein [Escherichia coli]
METANRLRESGKEAEAEAMLRQQPPSTRIDLTLADWAQQRRDYTAARAAYQNVLTLEPTNADAILGLTEVDIAAGDTAAARSQLAKPPLIASLNRRRARGAAQAQPKCGGTAERLISSSRRQNLSHRRWKARWCCATVRSLKRRRAIAKSRAGNLQRRHGRIRCDHDASAG